MHHPLASIINYAIFESPTRHNAERRRSERMSEWISVKDRLPDDAQLVLFRLRYRAKTEKGIHLAGCKTFETEYCCDWYQYEDVSHWMPLPPAPEQQ